MKKIFIVMSFAIFMAFCSAPSLVKADHVVGRVFVDYNGDYFVTDLWAVAYSDESNFTPTNITTYSGYIYGVDNVNFHGRTRELYFKDSNDFQHYLTLYNCMSGGIPTLSNPYSWVDNNIQHTIYTSLDTFVDNLPPEFQPAPPSLAQQRWDAFYEWYKSKYGYYPVEGSIIDILRKIALGDEDNDTEIIFPTLTPSPTPTPTPTPIPVQTIFVPDGNGNTTIIYQYPDPTTGVITQSPYNPNIDNNITVNCDCDGDGSGSNDNPFKPVSNDPYSMDASLFWADGFGVQMSDNPLSSTDDNQKSLKEAASEYSSSVEVLSNSFNVIPFKWLELVGLAGGILIIAGLIRTFLGG